MCGIAGAVVWADESEARVSAAVGRMTAALRHRGPDGHDTAVCARRPDEPTVIFGHTRLAIIDLSERGAQPMSLPDAPITVTFNGEIYNFASLRAELVSCGHVFRSDSDTEVLLHGYRQWGSALVDHLRGMFAFGIWDGTRRTLLLARDRFGIKPLYVYRDRARLLFASELRALLASEDVPRRIDPVALDQYLAYQTVPSPRTLVANVSLLDPGHVMTLDAAGEGSSREYWNLMTRAAARAGDSRPADPSADVEARLIESTRLHLVSDVPVGVFLSGGLDSSALALLVKRTGVTPKTFVVGFPGTDFDESGHAREVARAIGSDHIEIDLRDTDLLAALPEALASMDHPSGDGVNSYVVSRAVRGQDVKVALSGLGGDELFGGYPSFARLRKLSRWASWWRRSPPALRTAAGSAARAMGNSSIAAVKMAALLESDGSLEETFPIMRQVFSVAQRRELLSRPVADAAGRASDPYVEHLRSAFSAGNGLELMARVSYAEARTYMHDLLLLDTDQMSMCHGLEVRVPFLDHELAEYVVALPDEPKMRGTGSKPLLASAMGSGLPGAVSRPKQGFVLPFAPWMQGELRAFCSRHLGRDGLAGRGLFQEDALRSLWLRFLDGDASVSWSRPWSLVALDAWLERTEVRL